MAARPRQKASFGGPVSSGGGSGDDAFERAQQAAARRQESHAQARAKKAQQAAKEARAFLRDANVCVDRAQRAQRRVDNTGEGSEDALTERLIKVDYAAVQTRRARDMCAHAALQAATAARRGDGHGAVQARGRAERALADAKRGAAAAEQAAKAPVRAASG